MRYAPASKHESAKATSVATRLRQDLDMSSSIPATTGGKRQGSQADPECDFNKCYRRTGNLVEEVPQTPMSSTAQGTCATLSSTGLWTLRYDSDVEDFVSNDVVVTSIWLGKV